MPAAVMAQKKTDPEDTRKTKETVAMSQQVYEKLTEIQEMVEAKDYASAQRLIEEAKEKKLSDYERAQVCNLSAYSYYLQERYKEAIAAYDHGHGTAWTARSSHDEHAQDKSAAAVHHGRL